MNVETVPAAADEVSIDRAVAGRREFVLFSAALMGMSALSIDLMLPAFKDMRAEFGMAPGSSEVTWVITAFFLGMSIGPWFFGPPSDRLGRKRMLTTGLALFVAAALLAAVAPNFGVLLGARFLWGVAGGAPRALALAMIRDRYAGEQMARLMSLIMAVFILVPILAPGLGSALMLFLPWRAMLWIPGVVAFAVLLWSRRIPETLSPDARKPFSRAAFVEAVRLVVTTPATMCFGLAAGFLFGSMSGFIGSSESIFRDVYDYGDSWSVLFGVVAVSLGVGSLVSARFVTGFGLHAWMMRVSTTSLVVGVGFAALSLWKDGHPPFGLYLVAMCLFMPTVQSLVPNCNTAALVPLGHVAGTASAITGTISTAGGALLGNRLAVGAALGTNRFVVGSLVCVAIAAVLIRLGARLSRRASVSASATRAPH